MFDHYLTHQRPDSKRRKMLIGAAVISITSTFMILTSGWINDKLKVTRVAAPPVEFIMVQMTEDATPPPPPPPPPAAAEEEPEPDEDIPDEDVPIEEIVQPTEIKDKIPEVSKKKGPKIPGMRTGGVIGGVPGGVPGGVVGAGVATKAAVRKKEVIKPIGHVKANELFTPNPNMAALSGTKAAKDGIDGSVEVFFCVGATGGVDGIRLTKKFRNGTYPKVDQIAKSTVKKWRFKPFVVGGKPQRTCSKIKFNLKFK